MTIALDPLLKTPVSHAPLSAVAECGVPPSSFVHVTLSPATTVTLAGENAKLRIRTAAFAASATPASVRTSASAGTRTPNARIE
jgi:hypothetical protein